MFDEEEQVRGILWTRDDIDTTTKENRDAGSEGANEHKRHGEGKQTRQKKQRKGRRD